MAVTMTTNKSSRSKTTKPASKSSRPGGGKSARKAADQQARQARQAAVLLKLVSDPTRLEVILLLSKGQCHVGALSEQLSQSQPAVSHHLALLRHGGIIAPRRQGKNTFYSLTEVGRNLADVVRPLADDKSNHSESKDRIPRAILEEVGQVMSDPEGWMRQPNPRFEGRKPVELLGTPEERRIHLVIKAAEQGFFA